MATQRRPSRANESPRRLTQPARSRRLGISRPAGTRTKRQYNTGTRKKLDLTQILTLGAVLASLALAIPGYFNSKATLESTRNQNNIEQRKQTAERFNVAVEQLSMKNKISARLGGMYSLEDIVRTTPRYRIPAINVLSAFVRDRKPVSSCSDPSREELDKRDLRVDSDISVALTVLGRINTESSAKRAAIKLTSTCLVGVKISGNFMGARFTGSNLSGTTFGSAISGAIFRNCDLSGSVFVETKLVNVDYDNANLKGAIFSGDVFDRVSLSGANLSGVHLGDVDMTRSVLWGADLSRVDMDGINLKGSNLTEANLSGASLRHAVIKNSTFEGADLTNADISSAKILDSEFVGSQFRGVYSKEVEMVNVELKNSKNIPDGFNN